MIIISMHYANVWDEDEKCERMQCHYLYLNLTYQQQQQHEIDVIFLSQIFYSPTNITFLF